MAANVSISSFQGCFLRVLTPLTGMWQTDLADQCLIRGQGVLDQYGYQPGHMRKDIGIMMGIIVGYRIAGWIVLKLKK